ncbi:MAG: rhomboid family intramembrane serine protease [Treponema sp.]|jgi:membrane associated rhomboid family serine protease|nr:rhomboid family intramembrane serine protease [Treponema sp.]
MNILRKPFRYSFNSVVFYLIGINILVFIVSYSGIFPYLTYILALFPPYVRAGWVWQFVTYMFAHVGWQHLFFNMLGLFVFGWQVERRLGSSEFLLYYLLTGTLAGIISFGFYVFTGANETFLLGASGALFAVELAYATFFPDSIIYIWGLIPLRAPVMVLGYTALQLFFSVTGFQRGVAHLTHLSGFAVGWLYIVVRFGLNPWREFRRG